MVDRPKAEPEPDEQRSARLEAALQRYRDAQGTVQKQRALDALDEAAMDFVNHERSLLDYNRAELESSRRGTDRVEREISRQYDGADRERLLAEYKRINHERSLLDFRRSRQRSALRPRRGLPGPVEPVWEAVKGFLWQHRRHWLAVLALLCLAGLMLTTGSQHEALSRYAFYLLGGASLLVAYLAWRPRRRKFSLRWSADTWALLYFAGLAVLVLGSLLRPQGFIFALDTVWGLHHFTGLQDSASPQSLAPVQGIIFGLRAVLGPALSQSVFIFAILTLIGWAMYRAIPVRRGWCVSGPEPSIY